MPPPFAVRVKTATGWQDIAIQGATGPQGIQGPQGVMAVYEQPAEPVTSLNGAVWIDTDETPPTYFKTQTPIVSALPVAPVDGQEVFFQTVAMATSGTTWHLRYNAASASAYKWEFVGGPPLTSGPMGSFSQATTPEQTFTGGPSIAVPLAGDYVTEHGLNLIHNAASAWHSYCGVSKNNAASIGIATDHCSSGQYDGASVSIMNKFTFAAADAITLRTWLQAASAVQFSNAWLKMTPVRVG